MGLARLVTAVVFPVGLMMTIFSGGELFTGNCLIAIGVLEERINAKRLIRNLVVVYFCNLIGGILLVSLPCYLVQKKWKDEQK